MAAHMENAGRQPGVLCNQLGSWLHLFSTPSERQAQILTSRFRLSPWMSRDLARLCFGEGRSSD